jgi:hypothetical protein
MNGCWDRSEARRLHALKPWIELNAQLPRHLQVRPLAYADDDLVDSFNCLRSSRRTAGQGQCICAVSDGACRGTMDQPNAALVD